MKVGIPKERKQGEGRVAGTPDLVAEIVRTGAQVLVEHDAGAQASFPDERYVRAGAVVTDRDSLWRDADLVVKVKEPVGDEVNYLRPGQVLFCYLHLAADPALAQSLVDTGVTAIGFETVQDNNGRLPLLEPMSEIAGRLSALWGCFLLQSSQGGKGIVTGGLSEVPRARVLVLGGGTVGFHAAAVAQGLGAEVTIAERSVDRLGALGHMLRDPFEGCLSTPENLAIKAETSDLVIGAVLVPGHAAPMLLGDKQVASMSPGSVICDVAIDQGACISTSRPTSHAEPTYERYGVVHQCITNLPGAVPASAARALSNAIRPHVLALAAKGVDEACRRDEELQRGVNVLRGEPQHAGVLAALHSSPQNPNHRKVSK